MEVQLSRDTDSTCSPVRDRTKEQLKHTADLILRCFTWHWHSLRLCGRVRSWVPLCCGVVGGSQREADAFSE